MKRRGFTLTETIVAISIVLVLIAILLPVLAAARRRPGLAKSFSNLHQLALAMTLYESDHTPPAGLLIATPPSLVTLVQTQHLPSAILDSGAGTQKSGYTQVFPNQPLSDEPAQVLYRQAWNKHCEATGSNPIVLLDLSQDARMFVRPQRAEWTYKAYGVRLDGTIFARSGNRVDLSDATRWFSDPGEQQ